MIDQDNTSSDTPESRDIVELAAGVRLPLADITFQFSRSGGPGGQNVNKLATKVTCTVALDALATVMPASAITRLQTLAGPARLTAQREILIRSEASRSQRANRDDCIDRLSDLVLQAMTPPKPRKRKRISKNQKRKRMDAKRQTSEKKERRRPPTS